MQDGVEIITTAIRGTVSLDSDELRKFLLKNDKKEILITFCEFGKEKSLEQLGYFYGAIVKTLMDLGWTKKDSVNYLKKHCADVEVFVDPSTGERELILVSIADMGMRDLSVFIDECIRHLGEQGVEVPTPSQYWASKKVKK
jgi:hypothetical protein